MITAADVFPALVALLFMAAAIGFLALMEYRAQQRQHAEYHVVMLRRLDALAVAIVRALRAPALTSAVRVRDIINEAEAELRADEEPPAVPPDEVARAEKGGAA